MLCHSILLSHHRTEFRHQYSRDSRHLLFLTPEPILVFFSAGLAGWESTSKCADAKAGMEDSPGSGLAVQRVCGAGARARVLGD